MKWTCFIFYLKNNQPEKTFKLKPTAKKLNINFFLRKLASKQKHHLLRLSPRRCCWSIECTLINWTNKIWLMNSLIRMMSRVRLSIIQVNLGCGCSTAVERTPRIQEVMGLNPTRCLAFFYARLLSFTSGVSLIRSLKEANLYVCCDGIKQVSTNTGPRSAAIYRNQFSHE